MFGAGRKSRGQAGGYPSHGPGRRGRPVWPATYGLDLLRNAGAVDWVGGGGERRGWRPVGGEGIPPVEVLVPDVAGPGVSGMAASRTLLGCQRVTVVCLNSLRSGQPVSRSTTRSTTLTDSPASAPIGERFISRTNTD